MRSINFDAPDAELSFWPDLIAQQDCESYYQQLLSGTRWRQDTITIFGKTLDLPRLQAWYGDKGMTYSYSGLTLTPEPWTPVLLAIKKVVEHTCHSSFNSVLLNLYRDGNDSNGWHSDDETELGEHPVIASLSLGQERRFRLKHKEARSRGIQPLSLDLPSGSLLVMSGSTQRCWQHCLPKTSRTVLPRINLTFRNVIHGPSQMPAL
ncbi:alpha-ketoglutarate-dependent dioxygenase AlkB family protein [Endozoicomonas sp. 8E]|uniref:alpha-ketoglutarate-dependent dioxygenase AlkB family protein n=1 Tax=Endozoicomonas sp. 8E TaxID=3035692 RepID=UPI002939351B|nr:alpha-ketoglutarate-dependent dioxygenase AlkB [Endozoicomonas sp. 8E]WOG29269.1 alpha-ketoglutarate-dependent dioxygenase AlkB [Endozoicomonas sp. 8E]